MMFVVNEFLYMLIVSILFISSFVSSYVVLKRLFKEHVGILFVVMLFLMVLFSIVILIGSAIKTLFLGATEIEISIKEVVIIVVLGSSFGIFIAYEEHKGVDLPYIMIE